MKQHMLHATLALAIATTLVGCGGAPFSQGEIEATIAAGVAATTAARQSAQAPTSAATPASTSTAAANVQPTETPAPTAAPEAAPTAGVFAPASTTAPRAAPAATAAASSAPADNPVVFQPANSGDASMTTNIELVFDASGSMAQDIGGETRIAAARRAMDQVIEKLDDKNQKLNVGFRVFGHKGDNTNAGKAVSCSSTELLVPVQGVNKGLLRQQASAWQPTGWTPITLALTEAGKDLQAGENVRNVIIMVTDGEETCNADPCAAALALAQSQAQVRIDVVGFGQDPKLVDALSCITKNSGGAFIDAANGDALTRALEDLIGAAVRRSYLRVTAVGPDGQRLAEGHPWQDVVGLVRLVDAQGNRAPLPEGTLAEEGRHTPLETTGEQAYELAPGTYQFTVQQQLGWAKLRGNYPQANAAITYTAQIVEGQDTAAVVGVGGLLMVSPGGDPQYACDLALEVASGGRWQTAYPAPEGFCNRENGAIQGGDLAFDHEYPLLPGRYRLRDVKQNGIVADNFLIEPGKTVRITIERRAGPTS